MPAARYALDSNHAQITYTDPAQATFVCFFSLFSMTYMWLVRPERFELSTKFED